MNISRCVTQFLETNPFTGSTFFLLSPPIAGKGDGPEAVEGSAEDETHREKDQRECIRYMCLGYLRFACTSSLGVAVYSISWSRQGAMQAVDRQGGQEKSATCHSPPTRDDVCRQVQQGSKSTSNQRVPLHLSLQRTVSHSAIHHVRLRRRFQQGQEPGRGRGTAGPGHAPGGPTTHFLPVMGRKAPTAPSRPP